MITVTKPFFPPLEQYVSYLNQIWDNERLTNAGPFTLELEEKLKEYFEVPYVFLVSNGTLALQIAIKALGLEGEIITTPFSFIATTSSIIWEGCKPVFADIDPETFTINPEAIAAKITDNTKAILATHVYGLPCAVEALNKLATQYNLKLIYDAAHCFGVKYKDIPLAKFGDISTFSFHATKLFHTVEGGAIVTSNPETAHKIACMRNFGHINTPEHIHELGINARNSELHAAIGLCNLPYIPQLIQTRKALYEQYDQIILQSSKITRPAIPTQLEFNYTYYPVVFDSEDTLLRVQQSLNQADIHPRRYFYPALSTISYVEGYCPIAEDLAKRVLCLPLYHSLTSDDVNKISTMVLESLSQ